MNNLLISVLMPTHNYGRFIGEAIQSVLDQTYNHFELIVIDDASTDDTPQVIDAFNDDRIVPIRRTEAGGSPAMPRNDGLAAARGDLIAIADADDVNLPNRFEKQVRFFQQHADVDLLSGNLVRIDERGKAIGAPTQKPIYKDASQYRLALLRGDHPVYFPALMFRHHILERLQGFRSYPSASDAEFLLKASRYYTMCNLKDVLVRYRVHERSVSQSVGKMLSRSHHSIFVFQEYLWIQNEIDRLERAKKG